MMKNDCHICSDSQLLYNGLAYACSHLIKACSDTKSYTVADTSA